MRRPASVPKPVLDTVALIMLMSSRATAPSAAAVSQRPLVCAHLFAFMLSQDVFLHMAVRKRAMSLTFKSDHDYMPRAGKMPTPSYLWIPKGLGSAQRWPRRTCALGSCARPAATHAFASGFSYFRPSAPPSLCRREESALRET